MAFIHTIIQQMEHRRISHQLNNMIFDSSWIGANNFLWKTLHTFSCLLKNIRYPKIYIVQRIEIASSLENWNMSIRAKHVNSFYFFCQFLKFLFILDYFKISMFCSCQTKRWRYRRVLSIVMNNYNEYCYENKERNSLSLSLSQI